MLQITVPATEMYDESRNEFVYTKEQTLQLEHSLVSLSKWESKWCKSYISTKNMSDEETIDYIRCMTINKNVDPGVYERLTLANIREIEKYIAAPMSATYFSTDKKSKNSREKVTAELIYYWMIDLNIPFECQKWHLNRLLTLIRVCNVKKQPRRTMSNQEIMSRNSALNAARRKQFNTKG